MRDIELKTKDVYENNASSYNDQIRTLDLFCKSLKVWT